MRIAHTVWSPYTALNSDGEQAASFAQYVSAKA
jgi:hypothetical protein